MQTILGVSFSDFIVNGLFAFVDVFFAFFLWIIDRRNKQRQEESLDIILDQVAKVNQFQTRTLALAIESLGIEVENIKTILSKELTAPTEVETEYPLQPVPVMGKQTTEESFTNQLGKIISSQVSNLMQNIQNNVSEAKTSTQKESYKTKKGLEFDLKALLKSIDGLKEFIDINPTQEPEEQPTTDVSTIPPNRALISPVTKDDVGSPPIGPESDKKIINDLEEKVDNIKSMNDIDNLVNTIAKTFGKEFKITVDDSGRKNTTIDSKEKVRRKVVPNRSKSVNDNSENE